MALVDLEDLRVYACVARRRSMSAAAAELRLSQPSVSARMATLERRLRTRLLDRGPRGTALTPAGSTFLQYAERTLDLVDEAVAATRTAAGRLRLAVGAPDGVGPALFPWLVHELPEVEVSCRTYDTPDVYIRLRDGGLHAGFVLSAAHPAGIAGQPFLRDPTVAAVAAGHPLAAQRRVEPADLAAYPIAVYEPAAGGDDLAALLGQGRTDAVVRTVQPARTAVELALHAGYVAVVPWVSVTGELAGQRLRRLPVELPGATDVYVAWRKDRADHPAVAAFTGALVALRQTLRGEPVRRRRS